jgi:hypothetical protein
MKEQRFGVFDNKFLLRIYGHNEDEARGELRKVM